MKVYIWGIGKGCEKVLHSLKKNIEILGFVDNNPRLYGHVYNGKKVLPFCRIADDFDYITIAVIQYKAVVFQLQNGNIDMQKVICYYNMDDCEINKGGIFKSEEWKIDLLEQKVDDLERIVNIRLSNVGYEIGEKIRKYKFPIIKSGEEAVELILDERKSLIRFGDGEFEIMAGKERPVFQQYNDVLAKRLRDVIQSEDNRIMIAIANNYGDLSIYTDEVADAIREYMTEEVRTFHNTILKPDKKYYDAYMFKCYFPYRDKSKTLERMAQIKRIWNKRNVVLVEGDKTRTGCGNDLLEDVESVTRILCPTINAFSYYEEILDAVLKMDKENLILIVLGPAGKVLAFDLVQAGYQVVDIGQVDMDYEWYLANKGYRVPIENKYVSQLPPAFVEECIDIQYQEQIVARVGDACGV